VRLLRFRGEGDYLSQRNSDPLPSYAASFGYALALDQAGLFERLSEDSLFGCHTYDILGRLVSRDLLDSVLEIAFLSEMLGWRPESSIRVLDIGAGYGRFAHRLSAAFPKIEVRCTDAIPTSTFLAEFYLKFRKAMGAAILPLDEAATFGGPVDIACNIHSWSECTLQSIRWWLDRLDHIQPRYLFVVPHTEAGLAREADNTTPPFLPEIANHGWKLKVKRAKYYKSPFLMEKGVFPAWYFLYER
jgi:putative sugar O-methyltransferase